MRPLAWLAVLMLFSGCVVPRAREPPSAEHVEGICAQLSLDAEPKAVRLGEPIRLELTVHNCGTEPIRWMPAGICGGSPELVLRSGNDTFRFGEDDQVPVDASASFSHSCPPYFDAPTILAGASRSSEKVWNGSLAATHCEQKPFYNNGTQIVCGDEPVAPRAGTWTVEAELVMADSDTRYAWTATQGVEIMQA